MKRLIEEARRILRMSSVAEDGNEELSNYAAILMQALGLKVSTQSVVHSRDGVSKRQFNLIGILGDPLVDRKTRTGLMFLNPLDTSHPGRREAWTETGADPFLAEMKDGKIFGLGSASSKLDLLCKLYAIQEFRERKLKMPIYIVGVCGEDLGMLGAHYLLQSKALNPKYVLMGKPTQLKLVHQHRAFQSFRIQLGCQSVPKGAHGFNRKIQLKSLGLSASGAAPKKGHHAIRHLISFLQQAAFSGFQMQFVRIAGGTREDQVPDLAECELYLTSHQLEDFKRFFREHGSDILLTLGGLGDTGVAFLPESLFDCIRDLEQVFADFESPQCGCNWHFLGQKPGQTELLVNLSYSADAHPDEIRTQWTDRVMAALKPYSQLTAQVQKEKLCPALKMSTEQEWVRICREASEAAGISAPLVDSPAASSAGLFFASGYPVLMFGPGKFEDNVSSPNEHILLEDLQKAIKFYEKLIERVCL